MALFKILRGTHAGYTNVAVKNQDHMYVTTDSNKLFVGDKELSNVVFAGNFINLPEVGIEGKVYVVKGGEEAGVYRYDVPSTSYVPLVNANATEELTNKTIDADLNTILNLETDNFKSSAIATVIRDTGAVDTALATEKAVDDVRDALVASIAANKAETDLHIVDVDFAANTGVFTFTREDETTFEINTVMEELLHQVSYNETTKVLTFTFETGSTDINIADLVDIYTVADTATVDMSIAANQISANVKISATAGNGITAEADGIFLDKAAIDAAIADVAADLAQEVIDRAADVDAEEAARIAADSAETTARQTADATLQSNIDAEAAARIAADSTLQGNIDAEATARTSADNALDARLDVIEGDALTEGSIAKSLADAKAYTDAEIAAANADIAADIAAVQAEVDAEEIARAAADATLQTNIDTVAGNLATEITNRTNADNTLQTNITNGDAATLASANTYTDTEVAAVQADVDAVEAGLATEITDRAAADATLTTNLAAEVTRATTAEAALQTAIDAVDALVDQEVLDRAAADTALQAEIDAEEVARAAADTTLQGNIDAEATARATGDADTLTSANAYTDAALTWGSF
jgi:trimeric autotransporter adhesin